ncbi:MAG: heme ABC transporter ATP-binding protein [Thermoplasmata archaeon]|nr:MAG: heme ABC transporter ATP-binding protein [Thermoplasmata archaeon]HDJ27111.1 ABC transporter ATP-binding protein [Aciduliprofundum sp.]
MSEVAPGQVVLEVRGIVKRFPGVVANDHVDLQVRAGEVLALLGENGAGKTTLMNIIYGLYTPDEGEIYVMGRRVHIRGPKDAISLGIGMVHQHFMQVEELTVLENIILGLREFGIILDTEKAKRMLEEAFQRYGLRVDPDAYIWQLSAGEKQRVEIMKALFRGAKILILDEPTSVLTPQETKELFKTLRKFVEGGMAVIFITHKLQEVMEVADRIVVMRRGKVVGRLMREEATIPQLARLMVGREVLFRIEKGEARPGEVVLRVEGLRAMSDKGVEAVKGITFSVRKGEIVGVAGVAGNGQKELVEVLYGLRRPTAGRVTLFGKDVTGEPTHRIIKFGISLIPEERVTMGIVPTFSVADNLILEIVDREPFSQKVFDGLRKLSFENIEKYAEELIRKFDIRTPSSKTKAGYLSGGNIQKLILARELSRGAYLIIADQPTAGLDVGATEFIRNLLVKARDSGNAVFLVSGDLSEVLSLSDRVMVMYEGEITAVFRPGELPIEEIGLYMLGAKKMPKEEVERFWE